MTAINEFIKTQAKELESQTIQMRTYLYENPELSSEEHETVKFLQAEIEKLGLPIENVPNSTGFTVLLDTGKPGKTLGIRADIDALPVKEHPENLAGPRKYFSKKAGVMHACGHDGHMSIAITTMKILLAMKDKLSGKIYFIFEEGEEIGGGIEQMIEHLKGRGIDAIYGNHLTAFMDTGEISVAPGPVMAGAIGTNFTIRGQGGHGSRPDLSTNPIFAAANVLTGLTNAWANQIDVTKTVTLGLTQIHGGKVNNIIPDHVTIGGSLRFYDREAGEKAIDIFKKVATNTAEAHNCRVEYADDFKVLANPVMNDEKLSALAKAGNEELMPGSIVADVQWFGSESFNQYAKISPTLFAFVGVRNKAYGSGAEHHNDRFDIDENALIHGVMATTKFAADFLLKS